MGRAFGVSRNTLDYRLSKGWTPKEAVGLEPRPSHAARTPGIPVKVQGREFKNIKEAAKYYGRTYTHVIESLKKGRPLEHSLGLIKRTDTLQSENPELAREWHLHKNEHLTPNDVSPGSGRKVWWSCSNNHEWEAVINSRNRGMGCPYCARQRPTATRNFATEYPELLKEWDWLRNEALDPKDLSPRASQVVWWRCEKEHSWQATISNRTRKQSKGSCPFCANRKLCKDNSLARLRPDIAQDWHPTKNTPITPADVIAGGGTKAWWLCKHGHEWKVSVGSRVNAGHGCPKCTLQTSRIEIAIYTELSVLFNEVAWREKIAGFECDIFIKENRIGIEIDGVYWHARKPDLELSKSAAFEKEGIQLYRLREVGLSVLSARDISYKSSEDQFLVISKLVNSLLKHAELSSQQREKLSEYVNGPGLINEKMYRKYLAHLPAPPPGQSLADKQPKIAAQWAYDLNAPLSPVHFRQQANKKVWWRCQDGHTWKVSINNRTQHGTGCPTCPRPFPRVADDRNLAVLNPGLAKEWHSERNGSLRPEDVRPQANQKVWWKCSSGHEWKAVVASRASGCGCPYCSGRFASDANNLAVLYPGLLEQWDYDNNTHFNPSDVTPHVNKKAWWRCSNGHTWQATIYNRTKNKSGCPHCARNNSRKYTIEYFLAYAAKLNGKCLTEKYCNAKTKIAMSCENGHTWSTRAEAFLYSNDWCPMCKKAQLK